jgi:hypothetical protein
MNPDQMAFRIVFEHDFHSHKSLMAAETGINAGTLGRYFVQPGPEAKTKPSSPGYEEFEKLARSVFATVEELRLAAVEKSPGIRVSFGPVTIAANEMSPEQWNELTIAYGSGRQDLDPIAESAIADHRDALAAEAVEREYGKASDDSESESA